MGEAERRAWPTGHLHCVQHLTNMIGRADSTSEMKKATKAFAPTLEKSEKT
jgi:hypothetical protein